MDKVSFQQLKNGKLKTKCPNGRECMVFSDLCRECLFYVSHDTIHKVVFCEAKERAPR
jgi:hypothetical protein